MAKATGLSESTIGRIWRENGLKPHRVKTFKLSNDPRFVEKLNDIVGGITEYIKQHNDDPKPFVWRKTVDEILAKVGRARAALDNAPTA